MDITPYLDLKIAPRAVFDTLGERRTRARFFLPTDDGDWRAVTWVTCTRGRSATSRSSSRPRGSRAASARASSRRTGSSG